MIVHRFEEGFATGHPPATPRAFYITNLAIIRLTGNKVSYFSTDKNDQWFKHYQEHVDSAEGKPLGDYQGGFNAEDRKIKEIIDQGRSMLREKSAFSSEEQDKLNVMVEEGLLSIIREMDAAKLAAWNQSSPKL